MHLPSNIESNLYDVMIFAVRNPRFYVNFCFIQSFEFGCGVSNEEVTATGTEAKGQIPQVKLSGTVFAAKTPLHESHYSFTQKECKRFIASSSPPNIRLDEDVLKTSFVFVFRRRLQDVLIKANIFALAIRLQKTSSRRLVKMSLRRLAKISSKHLQDVFKTF